MSIVSTVCCSTKSGKIKMDSQSKNLKEQNVKGNLGPNENGHPLKMYLVGNPNPQDFDTWLDDMLRSNTTNPSTCEKPNNVETLQERNNDSYVDDFRHTDDLDDNLLVPRFVPSDDFVNLPSPLSDSSDSDDSIIIVHEQYALKPSDLEALLTPLVTITELDEVQDAVDASGKVTSTAVIEATHQSLQDPVDASVEVTSTAVIEATHQSLQNRASISLIETVPDDPASISPIETVQDDPTSISLIGIMESDGDEVEDPVSVSVDGTSTAVVEDTHESIQDPSISLIETTESDQVQDPVYANFEVTSTAVVEATPESLQDPASISLTESDQVQDPVYATFEVIPTAIVEATYESNQDPASNSLIETTESDEVQDPVYVIFEITPTALVEATHESLQVPISIFLIETMESDDFHDAVDASGEVTSTAVIDVTHQSLQSHASISLIETVQDDPASISLIGTAESDEVQDPIDVSDKVTSTAVAVGSHQSLQDPASIPPIEMVTVTVQDLNAAVQSDTFVASIETLMSDETENNCGLILPEPVKDRNETVQNSSSFTSFEKAIESDQIKYDDAFVSPKQSIEPLNESLDINTSISFVEGVRDNEESISEPDLSFPELIQKSLNEQLKYIDTILSPIVGDIDSSISEGEYNEMDFRQETGSDAIEIPKPIDQVPPKNLPTEKKSESRTGLGDVDINNKKEKSELCGIDVVHTTLYIYTCRLCPGQLFYQQRDLHQHFKTHTEKIRSVRIVDQAINGKAVGMSGDIELYKKYFPLTTKSEENNNNDRTSDVTTGIAEDDRSDTEYFGEIEVMKEKEPELNNFLDTTDEDSDSEEFVDLDDEDYIAEPKRQQKKKLKKNKLAIKLSIIGHNIRKQQKRILESQRKIKIKIQERKPRLIILC